MFFRIQVSEGPGFWGSRFFKVQVFLGPGFSVSGSRVRVQVLEVVLRNTNIRFRAADYFQVEKLNIVTCVFLHK